MKRPKLQLAIDTFTLKEAMQIIKKTIAYIDVYEVGTSLIIKEGANAIKLIKEMVQNKPIIADCKIVDEGSKISNICFEHNADLISASWAAEIATFNEIKESMKKHDKKNALWIELTSNFNWKKVKKLQAMGFHNFIYHHIGEKENNFLWTNEEYKILSKLSELSINICVTGSITLETLKQFSEYNIDTIIIGGAILKATKPSIAAKDILEEIMAIWS